MPQGVIYQRYRVPEMDGNPLIAALQRPTDDVDEQIDRMTLKLAFDRSERKLGLSERTFLLYRLRNQFFFPMSQHVEIYKAIEAQVIGGYWSRNPMSPEGQSRVHNVAWEQRDHSRTVISKPSVPATISFGMGMTGIGKSALIKMIAKALGPDVIEHHEFQGKRMSECQIVTLTRNFTDQPSYTTKAISKLLADRADEVLGIRLYGHLFLDKSMTRTHYVHELRRILGNHWVGTVFIDVFEHLTLSGTSGQKELVAMLVNLRDEIGVPITLVGTYKASQILRTASASVTRRFVDGGLFELKPPPKPGSGEDGQSDFVDFCNVLWHYQWLREPKDLNDDIILTLYDLSQGVTALLILLFRFAQIEAMYSKKEYVDSYVLRCAYEKYFGPLYPIIDALRWNKVERMSRYDDLYLEAFSKVESTLYVGRLDEIRQRLRDAEQVHGVEIPEIRPSNRKGSESAKSKITQRAAEILSHSITLPQTLLD